MTRAHVPQVSVLICTCGRESTALQAVRSVQQCGFEDCEILVVDQSSDSRTGDVLAGLCAADPRIRYLPYREYKGKPLALNYGLSCARGRVLALTDDDCEVQPGWLSSTLAVLSADARVACVFGDVDAPPYDSSNGFIPVCRIRETSVIHRLWDFVAMPGPTLFGIGANMTIRTEVLRSLGGWDQWIGPGTKFGSGDDIDLTVRLLSQGHSVAFNPDAKVLHFGFRENRNLAKAFARNGFGTAAIFAKHLKCGVIYPGATRLFRERTRAAVRNLVGGVRPVGAAYTIGWVQGFSAGVCHPVDRRTAKFAGEPFATAHRYAHRVADVLPANRKN